MPIIYASQIAAAIRVRKKIQFEIEHGNWLNKKKKTFGDMTKALYFTHGNLFEKYAIRTAREIIREKTNDESFVPQNQEHRNLDVYEKEYENFYLKFSEKVNFHIPSVINGVGNEEYKSSFTVSARPDGLFKNHVLEVKCPLGQLYKKKKPKEEVFDHDREEFIIPYYYKLQMIIEMLCHKKNKGYFFQYYQPNGWRSFIGNLHHQYFHLKNIMPGTRVYKPWVNNDDFVLTVLDRGYKMDRNIWSYYKELAKIPDRPNKISSTDKENFENYRQEMEFILHNINVPYLMKKGKTKLEARSISRKLHFGSSFKVGTVIINNEKSMQVKWDNSTSTTITYDDYQEGIIHILNSLHITRKEMYIWNPFFSNIKEGVLDPDFPSAELPLEHVLIELDMSDYIKINETLVTTKNLDDVEKFLQAYTMYAPWREISNLKFFLENLPTKVLNVYRGKSKDQKTLDEINEFLEKNPDKKKDVIDFVQGKSKDAFYTADAIKNILKLEKKETLSNSKKKRVSLKL